MEVTHMAKLLNGLAGGNCDLFAIDRELRKNVAEEGEDPVLRGTVWALNYMFVNSWNEEGRSNYGPFGPAFEIGGKIFPPI